jgi:hypothetical protein
MALTNVNAIAKRLASLAFIGREFRNLIKAQTGILSTPMAWASNVPPMSMLFA